MRVNALRFLAIIAAGFAVFAAAACGDDDDGPPSSNSPATRPETPQPGGTAPQGTGGNAIGSLDGLRPGTDEYYVRAFCIASGQFSIELAQIQARLATPLPTPRTIEQQQRELLRPLENYWKSLERSDPPRDVADWNTLAVRRIKDSLDRADKGDFTPAEPLPPFPEVARERIGKIVESDPVCRRVGLVRVDQQPQQSR